MPRGIAKKNREVAITSALPSVVLGGDVATTDFTTTDFGEGGHMKRIVTVTAIAGFISLGLATPAFGATPPGQSPGNPSATGNPTQSCQSVVAAGGQEPGNASGSGGSPFNEPSGANLGGNGGMHYAGNGTSTLGKTTNGVGHTTNGGLVAAQYDVACYHQPAK